MACLQGASAVQTVLDQLPQRDLRVYIIWVPVMQSDTGPPDAESRARLSDARVRHYWDASNRLAALWQPALKAEKTPVLGKESLVTGKNLWDFVAVFPPGARWDEVPPPPIFKAAPVKDFGDPLLAHLRQN